MLVSLVGGSLILVPALVLPLRAVPAGPAGSRRGRAHPEAGRRPGPPLTPVRAGRPPDRRPVTDPAPARGSARRRVRATMGWSHRRGAPTAPAAGFLPCPAPARHAALAAASWRGAIMARSAHPSLRRPLPAYGRDAAALRPPHRLLRAATAAGSSTCCRCDRGDVVLDVGCGTGLCFRQLQERIGPDGTIVGVDASPDMLAVAAERVPRRGGRTSSSSSRPCEDAELPDGADHALFCAVHDVLQSAAALDHVLGHRAPGRHGGRRRRQVGPGLGRRAERRRCSPARALRARLRRLRPAVDATSPSACPGSRCARSQWVAATSPRGVPALGRASTERERPVGPRRRVDDGGVSVR